MNELTNIIIYIEQALENETSTQDIINGLPSDACDYAKDLLTHFQNKDIPSELSQAISDLYSNVLDKYRSMSAAAYLPKITDPSEKAKPIPTGFKKLDNDLEGGLYGGFLYVLGALTSLGKTTFCLQIADQIAIQNQDVLFFTLEMSQGELIRKSLSRYSYNLSPCGESNATTALSIYRHEYYNINHCIDAYKTIANHIFFHEGIESISSIGVEAIKDSIDKHITITGNKPIVFIDYLQILGVVDIRASDKQNTDTNVSALRRICRDYGVPIIAISSFNRDNYNSPVNLASFKESGAIEYSSDVLLGLQYAGMDDFKSTPGGRNNNITDLEKYKDANPRNAQLKILKQRNGKTGVSLYFDYRPKFNIFTETDAPPLKPKATDTNNGRDLVLVHNTTDEVY